MALQFLSEEISKHIRILCAHPCPKTLAFPDLKILSYKEVTNSQHPVKVTKGGVAMLGPESLDPCTFWLDDRRMETVWLIFKYEQSVF